MNEALIEGVVVDPDTTRKCSVKLRVPLRNLVIIVGACIFCGMLVYPAFDAQWSIIDDHWAMHYVSKIKRFSLSFWHVFPLTLDSEVGDFGKFSRYRPSYHFLYVAEAFLWGNDPSLWWRARFGIFGLLFASLWWVIAQRINLVSAFVFTAWLFTPVYWVDIWGRLGPGEVYAALGFAPFIVGMTKWYECLKKSDRHAESLWLPCGLVTLGSLIATGSKENFVVLQLPVFLLMAWSLFHKKGSGIAIACWAVLAAYSALIMTSIFLYISEHKTDVYNREVTSAGVSALLWQEFVRLLPLVGGVLAIVGVVCALGCVCRRAHARSFLESGGLLIALLFLGLLTHVSQFVFYRGAYPTNMRYDFPGAFVVPFCLLAGYLFVRRTLVLFGIPRVVNGVVVGAVTVLLLSIIVQKGYAPLTNHLQAIRYQSHAFGEQIIKTANKCKKRSQRPILFDSYNIWDFERIASIRRFLLAHGVRNPMMLRINYSAAEFPEGSLERRLAQQLEEVSQGEFLEKNPEKDWGHDYTTFGFNPLTELRFDEKFLVIGFSARPHLPRGTGVGIY